MIPSVSQIIARRLRVTGLVVGWGGGGFPCFPLFPVTRVSLWSFTRSPQPYLAQNYGGGSAKPR